MTMSYKTQSVKVAKDTTIVMNASDERAIFDNTTREIRNAMLAVGKNF